MFRLSLIIDEIECCQARYILLATIYMIIRYSKEEYYCYIGNF